MAHRWFRRQTKMHNKTYEKALVENQEPQINSYNYILNEIKSNSNRFLQQDIQASKVTSKDSLDDDAITQHLLGNVRIGFYPETADGEAHYGCIDIDLKEELDYQERYDVAVKIINQLRNKYKLYGFIEKTKSDGIHIWYFYNEPVERSALQLIFRTAIQSVTEHKITNGHIEIFPKGESGCGVFAPFCGAFNSEGSFNSEFLANRKTAILKGMDEVDLNFPASYARVKELNTTSLQFLGQLFNNFPPCFLNSVFNWDQGSRNSLANGLAGVAKNIMDMPEDTAVQVITDIAAFRGDEEYRARENSVIHTYQEDKVAGCKILQGKEESMSLEEPVCKSFCSFIQKHREAEKKKKIKNIIKPVTDLKHAPDVSWVVENVFPRQYTAMMFGPAGIGKTWLLMDMALKLSNGYKIWNDIPTEPMKVLLLEGDAPDSLLKERVEKLNIKQNPENFIYVNRYAAAEADINLNLCSQEGIKNLEAIVETSQPDLVIVDTLISFIESENDPEKLKPVVDVFRQISAKHNCCILICHHSRKKSTGESKRRKLDQDDAIGSSVLQRLVCGIFVVDNIFDDGNDGNNKRNAEKIFNAGHLRTEKFWFKSPVCCTYRLEDVYDDERDLVAIAYENEAILSKLDLAKSRIVEYLKAKPDHKATRKELFERLGEAETTLKRALSDLINEKIIIAEGTTQDRIYSLGTLERDPNSPEASPGQGNNLGHDFPSNEPKEDDVVSGHLEEKDEPKAKIDIERDSSYLAQKSPCPDFCYINNPSQLEELLVVLEQEEIIALDLETYSNVQPEDKSDIPALDPFRNEIRLATLNTSKGIYIVDVKHLGYQAVAPLIYTLKDKLVIGHNLKFDLKTIAVKYGIENVSRNLFDTMLAAELIYRAGIPDRAKAGTFKLESVLRIFLGVTMDKEQQASDWSGNLTKKQLVYAANDVLHLPELVKALIKRLNEIQSNTEPNIIGAQNESCNLEMSFLYSMVKMELAGIPVNKDFLEGELIKAEQDLKKYTKEVAEFGFNPNSPKQVKKVLKEHGIVVAATDENTLKDYQNSPIVQLIQNYRTSRKKIPFLKTYLCLNEGRIYSDFKQISAHSGRMASSNPNVQNISKDFKKNFYKANQGKVIIKADYPGIELRIAAVHAPDSKMIEAFRRNDDLHRYTASLIFGKDVNDITPEERQQAKQVNFGFVYGMSPQTFINMNKDLGLSLSEAAIFRNKYLTSYPGIAVWQKHTGLNINSRDIMLVKTLLGRVIAVNKYTNALNAPVQGTGADILKLACVLFDSRITEENLDASIVNVIHDEIIIEAALEQKELVAKALKESMEAAVNMLLKDFKTEVEIEYKE